MRRVGARVCNRHPQNMIPTLKNEISFKITPLLLLFPLLKQVYQERALENNKKRVVFYIQINLYFCHKTLKVNRRFSTKSFVKDPQNTLSSLRTGLQDTGLFYNLVIIFFGLFFSPLSLHVQFPGTILHRSIGKRVCKGPDSESRCFLPSGEYLPVKQQQQQKTCYWKSSHKHLNQVFWICLGANLIKMLLA